MERLPLRFVPGGEVLTWLTHLNEPVLHRIAPKGRGVLCVCACVVPKAPPSPLSQP